jgi:GxxExxY protein
MCAGQLVHGELSRELIGAFYEVFNELGSGFLEQVYQRAMVIALQDRGIASEREVPAAVYFRGRSVGDYRMDLVVDKSVRLECKTAEKIAISHKVQSLNYLRATNHRLGMILNFGPTPTFKRVVNDTSRKH